jgi:cytochrome c-type biogenesis protein CcmH
MKLAIAQSIRQRRSRVLVVGVLIIIAATWLTLLVSASTHKTLDERVREVGSQLKCPICQGESVADYPSFLAQEMRQVIREQLQKGKSEQEVIQYFVNSYGSQIAWSPPWQGFTLLAWLVPIMLLLGGVVVLYTTLRDWRTFAAAPAAPTSLSPTTEEDHELANVDEAELEQYRALFEQELAADDPLFARYRTEAQ